MTKKQQQQKEAFIYLFIFIEEKKVFKQIIDLDVIKHER